MVERGTDADGEGDYGGGEAEGDLTSGREHVNQAFTWEPQNVGEQGGEGRERGGGGEERAEAYQIRKTIQLLPHHAALLSPARHSAVHEIKEHAKGQKGQRDVEVSRVGGIT